MLYRKKIYIVLHKALILHHPPTSNDVYRRNAHCFNVPINPHVCHVKIMCHKINHVSQNHVSQNHDIVSLCPKYASQKLDNLQFESSYYLTLSSEIIIYLVYLGKAEIHELNLGYCDLTWDLNLFSLKKEKYFPWYIFFAVWSGRTWKWLHKQCFTSVQRIK